MRHFLLRRLSLFLSAILCLCPLFGLTVSASPDGITGVSAQSAYLYQPDTDTAVWEQNAHVRMPMASTTKIMTAIVTLENADPDMTVRIPAEAVGVEGSSIYLHEGEELTVDQLLSALLMESANDAATALAIAVGGSIDGFAAMMNRKAKELGLSDTHFSNPHGLDDPTHYTTAADLAHLAAYCLSNPRFHAIVSTYRTTIPLCGSQGTRVLINHNRLLKQYDGAVGVKTGFTKHSGRCLVSAAERDGVQLIAVTLNAPDDWRDHTAMLDYGFSRFTTVLLTERGQETFVLPAVGGDSDSLTVRNDEPLLVVLPANHGEIRTQIQLPRFVYAPVAAGEKVGEAVYFCNGRQIGSVPLYACHALEAEKKPLTFRERILHFFGH